MKTFVLIMLMALAGTASASTPTTVDDTAFARSSGCMSCHAIDRRMVGPSFRDISSRYTGQTYAVTRMAAIIQRGGSGSWGPIPMPANVRLSPTDAKRLAAWSLSHR